MTSAPRSGRWVLETIFGGLGAPRGRPTRLAMPGGACRTRVHLAYDSGARSIDGDVHVWHEPRYDARESLALRSERGGRSALDGAFVSSAVGMACFGESAPSAEPADAARLALGGGVSVHFGTGSTDAAVVDVAFDADGAGRRVLRRRFGPDGGSVVASLLTT